MIIDVQQEVHCFYHLADHGRYEDAAAMFEKDGNLEFGPGSPRPGVLTGADIAAALVARRTNGHPTQRHVASNLIVTINGEDALATSLLVIYRCDAVRRAAPLLADVEQRWRRRGDRWRIVSMRIMPVLPASAT